MVHACKWCMRVNGACVVSAFVAGCAALHLLQQIIWLHDCCTIWVGVLSICMNVCACMRVSVCARAFACVRTPSGTSTEANLAGVLQRRRHSCAGLRDGPSAIPFLPFRLVLSASTPVPGGSIVHYANQRAPHVDAHVWGRCCLLYTSPSPRDRG